MWLGRIGVGDTSTHATAAFCSLFLTGDIMSTIEEIQLRRDVIVPMLPAHRGRPIHALISDAAFVVAWIQTGCEIKSKSLPPESSVKD